MKAVALGLAVALLVGCVGQATPTAEPATPRTAPTSAAAASAAPASTWPPSALPSPLPSAPSLAPSPAGSPTADAPSLDPPPQPGPFAIDLYRDGDFVSQASVDWCVPASILTMMNLIDREASADPPSQRELDRLARGLSTDRLVGAGSEPEGWAGALNEHGYGPYAVQEERSRSAAVAAAARALRLTGRPVGLLIWRGAHAWVMSGFEATADPALSEAFAVTHVLISDPWFPRTSSIWGPGKSPDSRISVADLAEDYLPWRRPAVRYAEKDGRFVLVVPTL